MRRRLPAPLLEFFARIEQADGVESKVDDVVTSTFCLGHLVRVVCDDLLVDRCPEPLIGSRVVAQRVTED